MRQHLRMANMVTSVNLAAGFAALLLLPGQRPLVAGVVLLAAVLDVVDGALARRAGGTAFGAQLDSLADLLCFCVVPAYALAVTVEEGTGVPAAVVGGGFLLAGAWRLARFPLVKQQDHFVGLPTPAAGALLLTLVFWAPPVLALAGGVLLAALMVSSVRFPSVFAAAATVRHSPLRSRRSSSRVRRIRSARPRIRLRSLRRPRSESPVGRAQPSHRRRAAARAGRLLRVVRRASGRRR